jgi:hypothetical protein
LLYRPGDILAVRGSSWLSKRILAATGNTVSHVALVVCASPFPVVIEAVDRVKTDDLDTCLSGAEAAWLLSDRTLTDAERAQVVHRALTFTAALYGGYQLPLQELDELTQTRFFTHYLNPWADVFPICSGLVADGYEVVNRRFGVPDHSTRPSDIWLWAQANASTYATTKVWPRPLPPALAAA